MASLLAQVAPSALLAIVAFSAVRNITNRVEFYWLTKNHIVVRSKFDHRLYRVLDTPHAQNSADILARTRESMWKVLKMLRTYMSEASRRGEWADGMTPNQLDGVRRLTSIFRKVEDLELYELDWRTNKNIAFNRNKSDGIFLCLLADIDTQVLASDDVVLFVALHELAHSMQKTYEPLVNGSTVHGAVFKSLESFLIRVAVSMNLFDPQNIFGKKHCRGILMES